MGTAPVTPLNRALSGILFGFGEAQHETNLRNIAAEHEGRVAASQMLAKRIPELPAGLQDEATQRYLEFVSNPKIKTAKGLQDYYAWEAQKLAEHNRTPGPQPNSAAGASQGITVGAPPPSAAVGQIPAQTVTQAPPAIIGPPPTVDLGAPPKESLTEAGMREQAGRTIALKGAEAEVQRQAQASGVLATKAGEAQAIEDLKDKYKKADPTLSDVMALNMAVAAYSGRPFSPGMTRPQRGTQMTGDQANAQGLTSANGSPIPKGPQLYQEFHTAMGDRWADPTTPTALATPGIVATGEGPKAYSKTAVAASIGPEGVSAPLGPPPAVNEVSRGNLEARQKALALAGQRLELAKETQPLQEIYDPSNGSVKLMTRLEARESGGVLYNPATQKVVDKNSMFNLFDYHMSEAKRLSPVLNDQSTRAAIALGLASPAGTTGSFIQGEAVSALSPDSQNFINHILNMRDTLFGLRTMGLMTPARSDAQIRVLQNLIATPGLNTAAFKRRIDVLEGSINNLRTQVPKLGSGGAVQESETNKQQQPNRPKVNIAPDGSISIQ